MSQHLTIALDGMGGDNAPQAVVRGANIALERFPGTHFLIYGDEAKIKPFLASHKKLSDATTVIHTDKFITADEKPSSALRASKGTSMRLSIEAVKEGKAAACVSGGNTGALMALAKIILGTVPGIKRPGFATFMPTEKNEMVMLDLGANTECDAEMLVQFALLGDAFARTALGLPRPIVGILNVGSEEQKGHAEVREAAEILRSNSNLPFSFHGFIEGNDLSKGTVDVVVTDGFTGNIALKTLEGTAKFCTNAFKEAFKTSFMAKIGYLFARSAMNKLRARLDPRRYNGAVFLGLEGIAVKSHGGTDAFGFASAIGLAHDMASHGFIKMVQDEIAMLNGGNLLPAPTKTITDLKSSSEKISADA